MSLILNIYIYILIIIDALIDYCVYMVGYYALIIWHKVVF